MALGGFHVTSSPPCWCAVNKRSLSSSFCLSTSICSFHHCYLCLPRLHENHLVILIYLWYIWHAISSLPVSSWCWANSWPKKCLDVSLNYSVILVQMWPNLARTGLQKYAACRQRSLSCHRSAKMIAWFGPNFCIVGVLLGFGFYFGLFCGSNIYFSERPVLVHLWWTF